METQRFGFDMVFKKLNELIQENGASPNSGSNSSAELDEIEELRRFAAELQEPAPPSFTTT